MQINDDLETLFANTLSETLPATTRAYEQINLDDDLTVEGNNIQYPFISFDGLNAQYTRKATTKKTTTKKKNYPQKNCPMLFGKQLNTLARKNIHFNQKKEVIFRNDEEKIKKFNEWLDQNCMNNLNTIKDFQTVWTIQENEFDKEFKETFKELSNFFFSKFAVRYISHSRIQSSERKKMFSKLIPQFLRGIKNPKNFQSLIR